MDTKDGPVRFCQQCGRFQTLDDFDGKKKSCRRKLAMHNAQRQRRRFQDRRPLGQPTCSTPAATAERETHFRKRKSMHTVTSPIQADIQISNQQHCLPSFQDAKPSLPTFDGVGANPWSAGNPGVALDDDVLAGFDIDNLLRSLEAEQSMQAQRSLMPARQSMRSINSLATTGLGQTATTQSPELYTPFPAVGNISDQWSVNLASADSDVNPLIFGAGFQQPIPAAASWNPIIQQQQQHRIVIEQSPRPNQAETPVAPSQGLLSASYSLFDMAPSELPPDMQSALASTLANPLDTSLYQASLPQPNDSYSLGSSNYVLNSELFWPSVSLTNNQF